jgi:hypothetical protein
MSKDEIFESVERFYHRCYLRPKPILRNIKTMLEDKTFASAACAKAMNSSRAWLNGGMIWKR